MNSIKISRSIAADRVVPGFAIGDKVHYEDGSVSGDGVIAGFCIGGDRYANRWPLVVKMEPKHSANDFSLIYGQSFLPRERPFAAKELKKIEEPGLERAFRRGDVVELLEPYGGYKAGSAFAVTGSRPCAEPLNGFIVDLRAFADRAVRVDPRDTSRPPVHCFDKRLKLLKASPTMTAPYGGHTHTLIVDDLEERKPGEFKVGDLVERISGTPWPSDYGSQGCFYNVKAVNRDGDIDVLGKAKFGEASRYKLIKKAEQIAAEKLFHSFASQPFGFDPFPLKNTPTTTQAAPDTPPATSSRPVKYRVISLDGATASSRTWDKMEDALKDAEKRAEHDPNYREFQVVAVVATAKAEKMKVITYKRGAVIVNKAAHS